MGTKFRSDKILRFHWNSFITGYKFSKVYIFADSHTYEVVGVITTPLTGLVVQRYTWIRYGEGKQHVEFFFSGKGLPCIQGDMGGC